MSTPGKGVVLDSGKRGLRSSGKSAVFNRNGACASCCGIEYGVDCLACYDAGKKPKFMQVVISGVVLVGGCSQPGGFQPDWRIGTEPSVPYNDTFVLTEDQVRGDCWWSTTLPCTGTVVLYSSSPCVGPETIEDIISVDVVLFLGFSEALMYITYNTANRTGLQPYVLQAGGCTLTFLAENGLSYGPLDGGSATAEAA